MKIAIAALALFASSPVYAQSAFDRTGDTVGSTIGTASSRTTVKPAKAKASPHKLAADGFYFEHNSEIRPKVTITFVLYSSLEELNKSKDEIAAQMKQPPRPAGAIVQAFSIMMGEKCEVHMMDPAVSYKPEYVGHELMHCAYSEHFHPTQESAEN